MANDSVSFSKKSVAVQHAVSQIEHELAEKMTKAVHSIGERRSSPRREDSLGRRLHADELQDNGHPERRKLYPHRRLDTLGRRSGRGDRRFRKTQKQIARVVKTIETKSLKELEKLIQKVEQASLGRNFTVIADNLSRKTSSLIGQNVKIVDETHFAQMSKHYSKDELTEIFNRRHFNSHLENSIKNYLNKNTSGVSLLFFDIDHFKQWNDFHDHQYGDMILKTFAKAIKGKVREGDTFARYGGEEFVLLLDDIRPQEAVKRANELRQFIDELNIKPTNPFPNPKKQGEIVNKLTISVGHASAEGSEVNTPYDLVKKADEGLYKAKLSGRNKVFDIDSQSTFAGVY